MTLAVLTTFCLATICLHACAFYSHLLLQWMRDTRGKTTTRSVVDNEVGETCEMKRLHIVGSRRPAERQDHLPIRSSLVSSVTTRSSGCGPGCNECERIAYERIARSSLNLGRRSQESKNAHW